MLPQPRDKAPSALTGMALAGAGYCLFAIQDAAVKWLVADYAVPQILFVRSVVIVGICMVLIRRNRHPSILKSPHRNTLLLRAMLMLIAWLCFYSAARRLPLAELTTLYFAAPIIVIVLSIFILREHVGPMRWLASLVGFGGVVLAANPAHAPSLLPAGMVLIAGFCWAWSTILVRLVSRSESTINQMMVTSLAFVVVCGCALPFLWKTPDAFGWCLMIGLGCLSGAGQYLLYEGFRHAPASTLAPIEYTGLVWAFLYGYLIWSERPGWNVAAGAMLIVVSSLALVWWEHRRATAEARSLAG